VVSGEWQKLASLVIPAQAGIQCFPHDLRHDLDPGFRRDDEDGTVLR
jgi:hypothetical protein